MSLANSAKERRFAFFVSVCSMKMRDVLSNLGMERAAGNSQHGLFNKSGRLFFRSEQGDFQILAGAQFAKRSA